MNLCEAYRSGRRFRRPGTDWLSPTAMACRTEWLEHDDWELEPVSVTLTAEAFWAAWAEVYKNIVPGTPQTTSVQALAKRLGLGT